MHIFPYWKLGCVLNSRYYFSRIENAENIIFLIEQVAPLKE